MLLDPAGDLALEFEDESAEEWEIEYEKEELSGEATLTLRSMRPCRTSTSRKLIPAARTATTVCPSPATGSGTSRTASAFAPSASSRTTALTGR